jgi:hypothetical protein
MLSSSIMGLLIRETLLRDVNQERKETILIYSVGFSFALEGYRVAFKSLGRMNTSL